MLLEYSEQTLFKKLAEQFSNIQIDVSKLCKYKYGDNEDLDRMAKESLKVITKVLTVGEIPRGDYQELAMLIKFYLSPEDFDLKLKQPGALHHARFMSQSTYYMKLKILSNLTNIQTTAKLKEEVNMMSEFISLYYGKWFLRSSIATSAPRADLDAIYEMKHYQKHHPELAAKCLKIMANH